MVLSMGAGFRHSTYGPKKDPGADYWLGVAKNMSSKFPDSHPEVIWIVGELAGKGTRLSFPGNTDDPLIQHSATDLNEKVFNLFDLNRVKVWLQVEPGYADVKKLLYEVITRYNHHPCILGAGVDVEWHQSSDPDQGHAVDDKTADLWLAEIRKFKANYRLFLKHWLPEKMPPHLREGLFFIDDGQGFSSLGDMLTNFREWAAAFNHSPVGFQVGYPSDHKWWGKFDDPPTEIGQSLVKSFPNTAGLYWVDFSVLDVFPPAIVYTKNG
jgi:hypothetical protein